MAFDRGYDQLVVNNVGFSLMERNVVVGDLVTTDQISEIEKISLPNVALESDWTTDDIFVFLNNYLDKIGMMNLQPRIQIRRVFYRRMNEDNWLEKGRIPWLNIFTIIIEHKILRLRRVFEMTLPGVNRINVPPNLRNLLSFLIISHFRTSMFIILIPNRWRSWPMKYRV